LTAKNLKNSKVIGIGTCMGNQENVLYHWEMINQIGEQFQVRHKFFRLCIERKKNEKFGNQIALKKCNKKDPAQYLSFKPL
jgi:hypothetical protein